MKTKKLIIVGCVLIVSILAIVILSLNNTSYMIKISLVDDKSPDRILNVYNNKKEKIEVKRIEYLDGTLLCKGYNMVVNFNDIKNEKKLKIILQNNKEAIAKIVEEEVR